MDLNLDLIYGRVEITHKSGCVTRGLAILIVVVITCAVYLLRHDAYWVGIAIQSFLALAIANDPVNVETQTRS